MSQEQMNMTGTGDRDRDLEYSFQKLVQTNHEIITELMDLLSRIQAYHSSMCMVKTTGTSVGAVGALSMVAGLCLTPVTAGTSAILSMGGLVATGKSELNAS
jgi:hypothetical protein